VFLGQGALRVRAVQARGNDFELIPTVTMESRHPVGWSLRRDFQRFVIISEKSRPEVQSRVKHFRAKVAFSEKDPLRQDFQNLVPKGFTISKIHVLCANLVKFGRPEVGKVARCFLDKKFGSLSRSRFCAVRAKNLSGPEANNVYRVSQMSSKSVHFRRSYRRTREVFRILGEASFFAE